MSQIVAEQCRQAHSARVEMGSLKSMIRSQALILMAKRLIQHQDLIIQANKVDLAAGKEAGISTALLDRLTLTVERISDMAKSLETIADLHDPIGDILDGFVRPNGLKITKVRVPLGVIGIIYEARPNVTADAIGLAIKTGNCVVLRGSASAYQSNKAIADILSTAATDSGVPHGAIQLLEDTSRESVKTFIQMKSYLSLLIPRGGADLINHVVEHATVPTIETGVGNCHVYVDQFANLDTALSICLNAKLHRPSVCNACESILVHQSIASVFLPKLIDSLHNRGVDVRGCSETALFRSITPAQDADWKTEYLDLTVAIKVVNTIDDAIAHIAQHGSSHSEAIISQDYEAITSFTQAVDAASILVNASTRFTDGGEFGFGAEMGISTQKLHARGPMGINELTTYKYIVYGNGQVRI